MSPPDPTSSFDARKLRGGNLVLPASILAALLGAAAAFGAANWRLTNLENGRTEDHQDRVRMEEHIENDDKELAVVKDHMLTIIEQLRDLTAEQRDMNSKLDQAEQERRK